MTWQTSATICIVCFSLALGCGKSSETQTNCNPQSSLLSSYTSQDGQAIQLYEDGGIYVSNENCSFEGNLFEPGFEEENYEVENQIVYVVQNDGSKYEVHSSFKEDFEGRDDWQDIFITDLSDRSRLFTNLTLQSPMAKTVDEYSELKTCLFEQTCAFRDNSIHLVQDPTNAQNTVLRFHAFAPTDDMIVSKSSVSTTATYFKQGQDFWYRARYYIEKGMPLTIADFESSYITRWGPRVLIKGEQLNIENKFMDKILYSQNGEKTLTLPFQEWFTLTVHFRYDDQEGIIQVWQNDDLIIDHVGQNIPLSNWVQDVIEVGLSAVIEETIMYVDDVEFGTEEF